MMPNAHHCDHRVLAATANHDHDAAVYREVLRLRALGRTPDDIATLIGLNPADIHALIFGPDESGTV